MSNKFNLNEILKKNPHINKEDLEKNHLLAVELRKVGMQPRGYQLATPFARRRVTVGEADGPDPRTINLTASRH